MWIRRLWLRLQSLFHRDRSAQQLDDEIQFHLEQQIAENLAAGMSRDEARCAAMRTFGNPTFLKEETRDTRGWIWLEQMGQNLPQSMLTAPAAALPPAPSLVLPTPRFFGRGDRAILRPIPSPPAPSETMTAATVES